MALINDLFSGKLFLFVKLQLYKVIQEILKLKKFKFSAEKST